MTEETTESLKLKISELESKLKKSEGFLDHIRASTKRQIALMLTFLIIIISMLLCFNPEIPEYAQPWIWSIILFATNGVSSYMGYSIASGKTKES